MNGIPVSVVMATKNRASIITRALDSVLSQSFDQLELVVVDDGSADDTSAVLARYAERDPRVRYVRHDISLGAPAARNAGIAAAQGEYVALLDDDAEWLPTKLAIQLAKLSATPEAGVAYCAFEHVRLDGRSQAIGSAAAEGENAQKALLRRAFIDTSCILVKNTAIREIGGFDESLPRLQDWDLTIRLAQANRFSYIPCVLTRTYESPMSISSSVDALVRAVRRMLSKAEAEGIVAADFEAFRRALAHALIVGGAPKEGRRLLLHGMRKAPHPLTAVQLGLAGVGSGAYRLVSGLRSVLDNAELC